MAKKKTSTTKSGSTFDAPQSRNEAILQNILGAENVLGEPQSRIEALLMAILEQGGSGGGLTDTIKTSLLALVNKVAYIDDDGQQYVDDLEDALYNRTLSSISAVFTQGSEEIFSTDSLDVLRQYLVVTANFDNGTSKVVTDYTLSGTLTVGTSTITATYREKTDTFTVNVSQGHYVGYLTYGTPSISNNVLTPSADGYVKTSMPLDFGNNSWAIRLKLHTISAVAAEYGNVLSSIAAEGDNVTAKMITIQNVSGGNGKSNTLWLSSDGSNWNISSAQTFNLELNTDYYLEIAFDGTNSYTVKSSTDGSTWTTQKTVTSSNKLHSGAYLAFGATTATTGAYGGTIDLSEAKIFVNGNLWWTAV